MTVNVPTGRAPIMAAVYGIAEIVFDGFGAWIIFSQGHPWWTLVWIVLASAGYNSARK